MTLTYSQLLARSIEKSGLSLEEISYEVEKLIGSGPTKEYLSRLKNGRISPASDKLNDALAKVLGMDLIEFKTAAYREKIPRDILKNLQHPSSYDTFEPH